MDSPDMFHSKLRPFFPPIGAFILGRQLPMIQFIPTLDAWITALGVALLMFWLATSEIVENLLAKKELISRFKKPIQLSIGILPFLILGIVLTVNSTYKTTITTAPDLTLNHKPIQITASDNSSIKMSFIIFNSGNATADRIEAQVWIVDNEFQTRPISVNRSISNSLKQGESYQLDVNIATPYKIKGEEKYYVWQDYYIYCILKYYDERNQLYTTSYGYEYNLNIPNYVAITTLDIERQLLSIIQESK